MPEHVENTPVNDNGPEWQLRGPDADDLVWLDTRAGGCHRSFDLGDKGEVQLALTDALSRIDYGDAPEGSAPRVTWQLVEEGSGFTLVWRDGETVPLGPRDEVTDAIVSWLTSHSPE
jgi:hypothetical protein